MIFTSTVILASDHCGFSYPQYLRNDGSTNRLNVANADTGLPGRPNIKVPALFEANVIGLLEKKR